MEENIYETKKKALLELLNSAEKSLIGSSLEQRQVIPIPEMRSVILDPNKRRKIEVGLPRSSDPQYSKYKHKDSLFKRPDMPIDKCLLRRKTPDYVKNPKKWQYYSLADVDTSETSNTSAAFSFLKELEERQDDQAMEEDTQFKKLKFNRSVALKSKAIVEEPESTSAKIHSTKIVMPEYVVGQKKKETKIKKDRTSKVDKSKEMRLQHLMDEDEEDC